MNRLYPKNINEKNVLPVLRGIQIKTIMRFHLTSDWQKQKSFIKPSVTGYRTTGTLTHLWWYLAKLKMLTSYSHQSCAHYIPQRNSCSGTLENVFNNTHSSPRRAKTNLDTNDTCIATEMTKTNRWYLCPVEYYTAVKNEKPLYEMTWIHHNIKRKIQVPEDYV